MDTQSQPAIAKGDDRKRRRESHRHFRPGSRSILVSQTESQKANISNFTGGEASNVTAQGNLRHLRPRSIQAMGMPKVANHRPTI